VVLGGTLAVGVLFFLLYVVTKMHFAEQVIATMIKQQSMRMQHDWISKLVVGF